MTKQKRIERKAVSLFAQVNHLKTPEFMTEEFHNEPASVKLGWLSLAKKVVRLENRVRIMRVKEFKK